MKPIESGITKQHIGLHIAMETRKWFS